MSKIMSVMERLHRTRFGYIRETGKEPEKFVVTESEMKELVDEFSALRQFESTEGIKIIESLWGIPLEVIKYVSTV